jgi:hypothetical protein
VADDEQSHAEGEPVMHERGAGSPGQPHQIGELHDYPTAEQNQDRADDK